MGKHNEAIRPDSGTDSGSHEPAAVWVPIGSLTPWDANPRLNDGKPVEQVAASIRRFGFASPIIARKADGKVIAGHTRLKAALALGLTEVPVRFLDIDPADAHLLALADNRSGEFADWDVGKLQTVMSDFSFDDIEMAGWDSADLDKMAAEIAGGEPSDIEEGETPEPPASPVTKLGDVWTLGRHTLVCGDAFEFEAEDVDVVFTDPPYGMRLEPQYQGVFGGTPTSHGSNNFAPIVGDHDDFDASELIEKFGNAREQFWFGADYYRKTIPDGGSWVVWDKRGDMPNLDKLPGSSFELCWSSQRHKREVARVLWAGHHGMQGDDLKTRQHPTQKPIALFAFFASRWLKAGDHVLDLFAGAGFTLIGCEKSEMRCTAVEITPAYCDVIVERWENLTGGKATRGG